MICILALIVFGILGIFSAAYRKIAFEAFDCVFRRVTLRKCETGLDLRLKSQITGRLMTKSPAFAKFTFKHFETISWMFTLLFIVSLVYTVIGGYNFYLYGNCNGPNSDGFCIFDPTGSNSRFSTIQSNNTPCYIDAAARDSQVTLANSDLESFPRIDRNAANDVVFIGCYACEYTRKTYPVIKELMNRDDVNFVFAHLAVKENTQFLSDIVYCIDQINKTKFTEFNDIVFAADIDSIENKEFILDVVQQIGLDKEAVRQCSNASQTLNITQQQFYELQKTGIYGTPTVFVNGEAVIGPKPYRVYARLLK